MILAHGGNISSLFISIEIRFTALLIFSAAMLFNGKPVSLKDLKDASEEIVVEV